MICIAKRPSPNNTMPGYRIPQKAYDMAINVPMEIADEPDLDPKTRLTAVKEIRLAIDQSHEIELITLQREALQGGGKPTEVIVREDETFFGNDAHVQAQRSNEATSDQPHREPGD